MSNAVGALQELTVKKGIPLPIYTFEDITEPSLPSRFKCQGTCYGVQFSTIASSKKAAKRSTATLLLERISSFADTINQTNDANGPLQENTVDNGAGPSSLINNKNAISLLQEYTVVHGLGYPKYEFRNLTQPGSGSQFECYGTCGNDASSRAIASSKSAAKLKVAENMYRQLHGARESYSSVSVSPIIEKSKSDGMLLPKPKETESIDLKSIPNPIGYLQEYTLKHGISMTQYYIKQVNESSMCIKFMCNAVCGTISVSKISTSKKGAKLQAAQAVLSELLNMPIPSGPSSICTDVIELDDTWNRDSSDDKLDNIFKSGVTIEKDVVSKLNEYCSHNQLENPQYNPMGSKNGMFCIQCALLNLVTEGCGSTKKLAKKAAAEEMLKMISGFEPNKILEEASSDDEIISKFCKLSTTMGISNSDYSQQHIYSKIEDFPSTKLNGEISLETKEEPPLNIKKEPLNVEQEPLNTKEDSVAIMEEGVGLKSSSCFFIDYVVEIQAMMKEFQDLGIEYNVIETSAKPYVMYFCYKPGQEISSVRTGSNPLIVKYKLLEFELNNIKKKLD